MYICTHCHINLWSHLCVVYIVKSHGGGGGLGVYPCCDIMYSEPLYHTGHVGTRNNCPDYRGVLNSGIEDAMYQSIVNILFQ